MDALTAGKLIELNRQFYQPFGGEFSSTRGQLQPGVRRIIENLEGSERILDLGCGNGRYLICSALARSDHTLPAGKKFAEIMEGSSDFTFSNRDETRLKTGLSGKPILLSVGRLDENKDPFRVLSGFLKLLNDFPDAKLHMIYSEDKLKQQVLSFINQNTMLENSVVLLGFSKYNDICDYYNSADYFVLGSHYEGSGFSLVEAMSCGVIPIVTDIPSFRMITNNGNIGALWRLQ